MDIKQEHLGYYDDQVDNFYVRALEATTDDNLACRRTNKMDYENWRYECS